MREAFNYLRPFVSFESSLATVVLLERMQLAKVKSPAGHERASRLAKHMLKILDVFQYQTARDQIKPNSEIPLNRYIAYSKLDILRRNLPSRNRLHLGRKVYRYKFPRTLRQPSRILPRASAKLEHTTE